jgi:hypothetical protein
MNISIGSPNSQLCECMYLMMVTLVVEDNITSKEAEIVFIDPRKKQQWCPTGGGLILQIDVDPARLKQQLDHGLVPSPRRQQQWRPTGGGILHPWRSINA